MKIKFTIVFFFSSAFEATTSSNNNERKYTLTEINVKLKLKEVEGGNNVTVRKNSSEVWKKFVPLRDVNTKANIPRWFLCTICSNPIENTYGDGTTTIFLRHLIKCGPNLTEQPKIDEFVAKRKPIQLKEKDKSVLMDGAIQFIVDDLRPYRAIECSGLFNLLNAAVRIGQANPHFQPIDLQNALPCAPTLRQNIEKKSIDVKSTIKLKLHKAMEESGGFACTSDTWTDDFKQRTYISVTCHINLLTESGISAERLVIAFKEIDEEVKSSNVIKSYTFDALKEYGISNEQISTDIYFVTDRGSNFKAITGIVRFNCKTHMFNNVMKEMCTQDDMAEIITNADNLISFVKKKGLNHKNGISVKTKCPTRFYTVLTSLESIVKSWEPINRCLEERQNSKNPRFKNCLSKIECLKKSTLMRIISFLKPFKEWTDAIEGELKNLT